MERWLPVPGFEGWYEVSDLGRVRSLDRVVVDREGGRARRFRGKFLEPSFAPYGNVNLRSKSYRVHKLVMAAFVGPCPEGMEVAHNDGDPTNNALINLRYDTPSGNKSDMRAHGTHRGVLKTHCPFDHLLVEPNLRACDLRNGGRSCLSCGRARARCTNARNRGKPIPDMRVLADEYYVALGFELEAPQAVAGG